MIRLAAIFGVLALVSVVPFPQQDSSQQKPAASAAPYVIPPNIANQANPVHPTPAGMEMAKRMYGYDCAMCHGKDGGGDGDMAKDMKAPLKNWHDPAAFKGMTDGELFYIIQKGKGEMPAEGDRQNADGIWNMVTLVRSFSKKH